MAVQDEINSLKNEVSYLREENVNLKREISRALKVCPAVSAGVKQQSSLQVELVNGVDGILTERIDILREGHRVTSCAESSTNSAVPNAGTETLQSNVENESAGILEDTKELVG